MTEAARQVVAIVPAAGSSSRFGSMKLLADVGGQPLLERTLRSLVDAGVGRIVLVVAAGHELASLPLISDPRVTLVTNPDPSRGMFSSIQRGLASVDEADVLLVLPADMPFVPAEVVASVARACGRTMDVVVPSHQGRRGHPVGIPGCYRAGLIGAAAASTLRTALAAVAGGPPTELAVDSDAILKDVDVPQDLDGTK